MIGGKAHTRVRTYLHNTFFSSEFQSPKGWLSLMTIIIIFLCVVALVFIALFFIADGLMTKEAQTKNRRGEGQTEIIRQP